jgi:hypothetical protein
MKAWADEQLEAYNSMAKTEAELYVDYRVSYRAAEIAEAEYDALVELQADIEDAEDVIADLVADVEDWTEEIAELEQDKIDAADFTTYEDAVAYWTKIVELDEAKVAARKVDADAKKAAFEAASATPAE